MDWGLRDFIYHHRDTEKQRTMEAFCEMQKAELKIYKKQIYPREC